MASEGDLIAQLIERIQSIEKENSRLKEELDFYHKEHAKYVAKESANELCPSGGGIGLPNGVLETPQPSRPVCRFFGTSKGCDRGPNCHFAHIQ